MVVRSGYRVLVISIYNCTVTLPTLSRRVSAIPSTGPGTGCTCLRYPAARRNRNCRALPVGGHTSDESASAIRHCRQACRHAGERGDAVDSRGRPPAFRARANARWVLRLDARRTADLFSRTTSASLSFCCVFWPGKLRRERAGRCHARPFRPRRAHLQRLRFAERPCIRRVWERLPASRLWKGSRCPGEIPARLFSPVAPMLAQTAVVGEAFTG